MRWDEITQFWLGMIVKVEDDEDLGSINEKWVNNTFRFNYYSKQFQQWQQFGGYNGDDDSNIDSDHSGSDCDYSSCTAADATAKQWRQRQQKRRRRRQQRQRQLQQYHTTYLRTRTCLFPVLSCWPSPFHLYEPIGLAFFLKKICSFYIIYLIGP